MTGTVALTLNLNTNKAVMVCLVWIRNGKGLKNRVFFFLREELSTGNLVITESQNHRSIERLKLEGYACDYTAHLIKLLHINIVPDQISHLPKLRFEALCLVICIIAVLKSHISRSRQRRDRH